MQGQRFLGNALLNKRKRHQVFQRDHNALPFQRTDLRRAVRQVFHPLKTGAQNVHPPPDKAGFQLKLGRVAGTHGMTAVDPTAIGMPHHHDICDLQRHNRKLDCRRRAVMIAVRFIGRHQIGDIAVDEKLAGFRPENRRDMHPAVATGNHHHTRMLTVLGQAAIPRLVVIILGRPPAVIPINQIRREGSHVIHQTAFFVCGTLKRIFGNCEPKSHHRQRQNNHPFRN